ncbi:hypothetical protein DPMN_039460 [Dreissena polymorpha]|uniref:Uncharacterized protein n=1 Tax=Dreissena polymorpha TaxID=45954 RepID=A0A9D4CT99_DREPO|nr:hypothetical protein DPMN_039460 [Dreissena polymorpha]
MDTSVYPGHYRLLHERPAQKRSKSIHNSLCDNGHGDILLCSSLFVDSFSSFPYFGIVNHERAGPSTPGTLEGVIHFDRVCALRCQCPSILQRWAARPRHWPSPAIVQKVVSLGAYLTPVGFKGSEFNHMEWRLCFNTGETELVNNLNCTQAHVYVMLKMILKDVLRPRKKEVTSYVIKNIILWQVECNPQNDLNTRSFFHRLHDGLRELKTAIATQQMPYYMIPERNLMAASGLQDKQQCTWVTDITNMMAEGPMVILRLPKIRQAIVASPEPMLWYSKTRMELEMLVIEMLNRHLQCSDEYMVMNESDDIWKRILRRKRELLVEVSHWMRLEGSAVYELNDIKNRILI